jgi:hypothetical protein
VDQGCNLLSSLVFFFLQGLVSKPNGTNSVPFKMLAAVGLSITFFAWLVASGRFSGLPAGADNLTPGVLALAAAGLISTYLLRSLRVFHEFKDATHGRFVVCLRIVLFHNAWVNLLPMRSGELVFPLLLRRHFGIPAERAVASLLWLRLQDAFVLTALALLIWPDLSAPLRAAALAALMALGLALPWWAGRARTTQPETDRAGRLTKLRDALADSARHARIGWLWTLANWSIKLAVQAWLLAQILAAPLASGAAGALGAELAAILPVQGVAGFGSYEAGAATALLPSGILFSQGLQAALVLHLCILASALSMAALAWLIHAPARKAEATTPSEQPFD